MKIGNNVSMNSSIDSAKANAEKATDDAFKDMLERAKKSKDKSELKKVAEDFESIFINMMFKSMRGSSENKDGFIEKSNARSMFESMYDEELSKVISKSGGFGISDMIYKSLNKNIENTNKDDEDKVKSIDIKG
ncbi:rod-binding protein [Helicovermis profundi]|uniref:Flagellar protein FlgJ N-terminal domain-containing protein n=1 Tax=Helicovermis profundi TaxID=3065157 RepID=A0AAU9EFE8_9FIRM|nr:hypothetical protein HLPR_25600 [Clostridia bacterium S502]